MTQVVKVMMYLIEDDSLVGTVLFIDPSGHAYHHTHSSSSLRRASLTPRGVVLPPRSKSRVIKQVMHTPSVDASFLIWNEDPPAPLTHYFSHVSESQKPLWAHA